MKQDVSRKKASKTAILKAPIRKRGDSSAVLEAPIKKVLNGVSVKWVDASFSEEEFTQDEIDNIEPIVVFSCGYIVRQDKKVTVLAQSYYKHSNKYKKLLTIPTSLIIETK